ncbi:BRO-N domain-containing protein [Burkholderia ambifaria]|uniref:BRO-N domain-containing protein n=2 Tax=Burkholderia ambifaria TaxID=152480 RepID=UPI00158D21FF|nr:Bro-N domain-containing protein [Burkholderia ambifaria]
MAIQNPPEDGVISSDTTPHTFNFENLPIRTTNQSGEVWFVAADVCTALEIGNPRQAVTRLDDDERDTFGIRDALGRQQDTVVINESGLYSLILSSRKPQARAFKRWVTHEVLPSIRKTGRYESAAQPSDPDRIDPRTLLLSEQSNLKTELPPKVADAVDRRAWELAREAYELTREHLRRRIAFRAAGGNPMVVNEQKALQVIMEGDLGDALAHGYHFKINCIERFVATSLQTMNELAADIRESKQRLLRPQSPTENRL